LYLAKLFTTVTMHILTYRFYNNALKLMKYISNHPEKFDNIHLCFGVALIQIAFSCCIEYVNVLILSS
jgi:hypothetical protein